MDPSFSSDSTPNSTNSTSKALQNRTHNRQPPEQCVVLSPVPHSLRIAARRCVNRFLFREVPVDLGSASDRCGRPGRSHPPGALRVRRVSGPSRSGARRRPAPSSSPAQRQLPSRPAGGRRPAHPEFRRLTGRSGPGAGRPAKLYRRADRQWSVSLPDRHYDLVGDILASGIERARTSGTTLEDAIDAAASETGRAIGSAAAPGDLDRFTEVLADRASSPAGARRHGPARELPVRRARPDPHRVVCGLSTGRSCRASPTGSAAGA